MDGMTLAERLRTHRSWECSKVRNEAADALDRQAREIARLKVALHATITRNRGIVPDVALEFYDQSHPALERMALPKEPRDEPLW